ncbi:recombinase family protein [Bifidobacterium longum]|uniref:recombinase family protein n=1 Tax=Bacillati TaxID=1783272 RepID=UPI00232C4A46|nr:MULTISPECIES: recombinase family protein [Terrabacteria group]MDB6526372.1 recombinase family protein [Bifidobacterium pseudocatenulatum]MDB6869991.1 recombinase family protein [Bifidobacterium longum]MDB8554126.1 recombinase family protein [Turicibacter sanguinis]MDC1629383.1 recombinase family protein [Phocaeicola vulgatus]
MTIYGYARVSTKSQKLERQVENLLKYEPTITILKEKYTGTKTDRPIFNKLLKRVKKGDTIIFDSVSRMSRNAEEGFDLYKELFTKGVNLVFLKEPHINTSVYAKALGQRVDLGADTELIQEVELFINRILDILAKEQIQIAFNQAEKEVLDIQTRVKEGIRVAKENGKQIGRAKGTKVESKKAKLLKQQIFDSSKDFNGDKKDVELMQTLNISRNTYYKYKREIKEEVN